MVHFDIRVAIIAAMALASCSPATPEDRNSSDALPTVEIEAASRSMLSDGTYLYLVIARIDDARGFCIPMQVKGGETSSTGSFFHGITQDKQFAFGDYSERFRSTTAWEITEESQTVEIAFRSSYLASQLMLDSPIVECKKSNAIEWQSADSYLKSEWYGMAQ